VHSLADASVGRQHVAVKEGFRKSNEAVAQPCSCFLGSTPIPAMVISLYFVLGGTVIASDEHTVPPVERVVKGLSFQVWVTLCKQRRWIASNIAAKTPSRFPEPD
jgi:hypothetical protein